MPIITKTIDRILRLCLILTFVMIGFIFCHNTNADTYVSGTISTDTTWDLAGSPYRLSGNLTVQSGTELTIATGVEVTANYAYRIYAYGVFNASITRVILQRRCDA